MMYIVTHKYCPKCKTVISECELQYINIDLPCPKCKSYNLSNFSNLVIKAQIKDYNSTIVKFKEPK